MLIKDTQGEIIRKYGEDCHDSLAISSDGRTLSYYNLQNGDGSRYGDYRFVMEDGEVPLQSNTPDAIHAECYFNIGGFPSAKQIRAEALDEYHKEMQEIIEGNEEFTDWQIHEILYCNDLVLEQLKEKANG
jgi:hypothetical protein